eukprot:2871174-Prymnesium_polylepis.3
MRQPPSQVHDPSMHPPPSPPSTVPAATLDRACRHPRPCLPPPSTVPATSLAPVPRLAAQGARGGGGGRIG